MSKELPYFRFYVSEWLNDDISLEDELTKGVFIDVCAFYWFRDCSMTKAMLEKRFSNTLEQINILFNSGIIKEKNGDEFIEIKFLDIQFDELSELRKRRQEAGRKGGKQGLSKPKAKPKQNPSYKDKDKDKDKYKNIIELYHNLCPKMNGVKAINDFRKGLMNARLSEYGIEKITVVLRKAGESDFLNGRNDKAWKADFEWILRPQNFIKVLEGKYENKITSKEPRLVK